MHSLIVIVDINHSDVRVRTVQLLSEGLLWAPGADNSLMPVFFFAFFFFATALIIQEETCTHLCYCVILLKSECACVYV